jgi:hypothetical protein
VTAVLHPAGAAQRGTAKCSELLDVFGDVREILAHRLE